MHFFQAEDGIRDAQESRWLGDVYKRQDQLGTTPVFQEELYDIPRNSKNISQQELYDVPSKSNNISQQEIYDVPHSKTKRISGGHLLEAPNQTSTPRDQEIYDVPPSSCLLYTSPSPRDS